MWCRTVPQSGPSELVACSGATTTIFTSTDGDDDDDDPVLLLLLLRILVECDFVVDSIGLVKNDFGKKEDFVLLSKLGAVPRMTVLDKARIESKATTVVQVIN